MIALPSVVAATGDLRGLAEALDTLAERLGITAVWVADDAGADDDGAADD